MSQSLANIVVHLVFSTKDRAPFIKDSWIERLHEYLGGTVAGLGGFPQGTGGVADHVHLLVECDPQLGIHRLVRLIKGRSSRLLRQEFPVLKRKLPTLWTNSYFVSTVGGVPLSVMKQYIENQKHV